MTDFLSRQARRKKWTEFYPSDNALVSTGWGYWPGFEVMAGTHQLREFDMHSNMHAFFTKLGSPTRYRFKDGPVSLNPLLVEDSFSVIGAGSTWLVESDGSPQTNIGIKLDPVFLDHVAEQAGIVLSGTEVPTNIGTTDPRMTELLKLLAEDFANGSPYGRIFGESLGHVMCVHFARTFCVPIHQRAVNRSTLTRATIQRVKDYVRGNLHAPLTLAEIADYVGYSPYHLHRAFRAETGVRMYEYILGERLQAAQFLLRTSDWPVSRIAAEVGFTDASHLSRQMTKTIGVTPTEFRRSAR